MRNDCDYICMAVKLLLACYCFSVINILFKVAPMCIYSSCNVIPREQHNVKVCQYTPSPRDSQEINHFKTCICACVWQMRGVIGRLVKKTTQPNRHRSPHTNGAIACHFLFPLLIMPFCSLHSFHHVWPNSIPDHWCLCVPWHMIMVLGMTHTLDWVQESQATKLTFVCEKRKMKNMKSSVVFDTGYQ